MELKKSKEADLESKRIVFTTVGLVMVSAIVLMAFTYTTAVPDEKIAVVEEKKKVSEELVFEMIEPQEEPPAQQESAPPPPDLEEIEIVDNEEEIEEINFDLDPEELPPPPDETPEIIDEPIQDFVEVDPAFPGGEAAMIQFIQKNVVYPELSREMGEQGTVYVQFVVNSDGSIQDVVILKGVSDALNKEAMRVVKQMPAWSPGEQAGKKVRVRYQIPIKFTIAG